MGLQSFYSQTLKTTNLKQQNSPIYETQYTHILYIKNPELPPGSLNIVDLHLREFKILFLEERDMLVNGARTHSGNLDGLQFIIGIYRRTGLGVA